MTPVTAVAVPSRTNGAPAAVIDVPEPNVTAPPVPFVIVMPVAPLSVAVPLKFSVPSAFDSETPVPAVELSVPTENVAVPVAAWFVMPTIVCALPCVMLPRYVAFAALPLIRNDVPVVLVVAKFAGVAGGPEGEGASAFPPGLLPVAAPWVGAVPRGVEELGV